MSQRVTSCEYHDWLYMSVTNNVQSVKCRRCGMWDSFEQRGLATEYPAGTFGKTKAAKTEEHT